MKLWSVRVGTGFVSVVSRPQGDELLFSEMEELVEAGVTILVSVVEHGELPMDGLLDEELAAPVAGLRFFHHPIEDHQPPPTGPDTLRLLDELAAEVRSGAHLAVHCHEGHGRSPAFACGVMVMAGMDPEDAMRSMSEARGKPVPHRVGQRDWVRWVAARRALQDSDPQG